MPRFLSLIIVVASFAMLVWLSPSTGNPNPPVDAFSARVPAAEDEWTYRLLFGMTDREDIVWDGSLTVSRGAIARVEPWRFDGDDRLDVTGSASTARWKISTRQGRAFGAAPQRPVVANGILVTFRNLIPSSEVSVETAQGKFSFRISDAPYGKAMKLLDGRVIVDRVPASARVVGSREEQDYPAAAADRQGNVWLAYVQFTANPKFTGIRWSGTSETKNFSELAEPAGGDQVLLARQVGGTWSEPVAVTETGGDLYKPALAVDGSGRVWVFWSANEGGNFDLYARPFEAGKGGKTVKLTSDSGPDIAPVAATDAKGRVWVAWQGFRSGRSQIRAAYQQGEWTQPFRWGGHHNVFFKTDKGRYVTRWEAPRPAELYEKLRAIDAVDNVLIIPHAHEPGDWNFTDSEMERLVEIFSMHGSFEYFGQRYLRRGYRMGLVAASDDHTGHPGYSPAVVSTRNGLAAVYSSTLDRDSIWRGMKGRATYATSNATRPVVKMTVDGNRVGGTVPSGAVPTIKARVLGTAAIDHIDVIHNGEVEYRKDYLTPSPTDPSAVQIMFHTLTETPGDGVMSPRGGVGWGGWIEVSGGRIASIEPLNVDHHTDEFHQVDDRRIWFTCRTRGDFDGLLIRLSAAPADAQIKVIVSELTGSTGGTGASGYVVRPPGPPSRKPQHEISFKLSDVAAKRAEFNPAPNAYVYARKARADAPWDVSFSYRPTRAPAQDDYYYLRVVHIDGEVAWVSPVWIGEQTSPRKGR